MEYSDEERSQFLFPHIVPLWSHHMGFIEVVQDVACNAMGGLLVAGVQRVPDGQSAPLATQHRLHPVVVARVEAHQAATLGLEGRLVEHTRGQAPSYNGTNICIGRDLKIPTRHNT